VVPEHNIFIRRVVVQDIEQWLSMRLSLWPDTDEHLHRKEIAMMLANSDRNCVFVCEDLQGVLIGFSEVSLREWAEGCLSSPVGYLEGWFVKKTKRKKGAGAKLLSAAEDWARSHGCSEMASDTNLGNTDSEAAHRKLGYQVTGRVITFKKDLGPC